MRKNLNMSNESLYWFKKIRRPFHLFSWMLLYFASTDNCRITYMMWLLNMFPTSNSLFRVTCSPVSFDFHHHWNLYRASFCFPTLQSVQTHVSAYISITRWLITLISKIFLICFPHLFHIKSTYLFQAHPVKMEWVSSTVAHGALDCETDTFLLSDQSHWVEYVCSIMAHWNLAYEKNAFLLSDKSHWGSDLLQTNFS